ncbi:MAG: monofunctional biosynthetic peptidoglycan transglycosylase [Paludibacter sp.]|nr:monofunctional biosynthetic peptidoglycan transglycosylase [Paludibacter sp.]
MGTNNKTKSSPKKPKFFKKLWIFFVRLVVVFFIVSISWVVLARFVPVFFTPLMIIRSVEAISSGNLPKNSKKWMPIKKISPNMVQAVVASEDNLFMEHHGFSINDIQKAVEHNKKGKRIRGGSTISQQTAKNVFLWPQRSYLRKGLEAYFTVLIELVWSKERIMEVYLNVIEMGNGIYGVEAAALEHFGVNASRLSKSQAALIAACLPNPRKYNAGNPSGYISRRKSQISNLMGKVEEVDFGKPTKAEKINKKKRK